jgi:hypothetical protein
VTATKVYDGTTSATISNAALLTLSNVPAGDANNAARLAIASPVAQYSTKGVATGKSVTLTSAQLSGTSAGNYTLSLSGAPTTTANVTPRALLVTATGINKTYDGTTTATVNLSSDKFAADTIGLNYTTATFSTKNVETGKTVSVSGISLSGVDAANYTPNTTTTTTANITLRTLTVTISAANKVYDAGTSVSVTYGSNKLAADTLTITGTATFASKAAGTSRPVNATSISVTGADAANYSANTTASTTANITPKPLLVTITASNKVYSGNTSASVTYIDDRIAGDSFAVSGTSLFSSAAVGNDKTVTASSIFLSGTDAANYSPNSTATTTASITVKTLNVTISGGAKTYDASTTATPTYSSDQVSGDTLTITGTATYADKNAGTNKTITATGISISGASSGNYVLSNTTATTTATISKRTLTITGTFTASPRVYDGTTDATGNVSVPGSPGITPVQGSDSVSLIGTPVFTYASQNVGTGITITGSGYSITGTDSVNYQLTQLTLSSNITVRTVTIGGTLLVPSTKTYDATVATTITDTTALTLVNVAAPDAGNSSKLALSGLVAQYANKNVADAKTVSITSAGITGTSSSNYLLSTSGAPTATSSITLRSLNVTIAASNRVYNASTTAAVTYSDNRVSGDVFTVSGTATFDSKNFGNLKTVTANSITLSGADAANYSHNLTATTTANITRRPLTVTGTFSVAHRQYDATTDANAQVTVPVSAGLSDVQSGDDATLTGTPVFTFAQATVGNSIAISTSGYSVSGADAANYSLTQPSFTANITQRPLTIGGSLSVASTKVYNRSTGAVISDTSLLTLVNVPDGDANNPSKVALTSLTATYDSKNVGVGKTVSVATASLTGSTASNYTITTTGAPTTTADITQRPITLGFTLSNRTYDGTVNASVTFTDTRISGDSLTVSGTPTFADKNVGTSKTVTATNMSISGTDAGNYSFNTTATATASIQLRSLNVSISASSKTYDGNAIASVVYADNRVSGDIFTVSGTATFSSKTFGLNKTVTATGISLSGTDAANYTPNTSTTTTATINRRTLNVTITASNKVYDRNVNASVTYSDDRVSGDIITISGTPTFSDKNVGTGKTVTASGVTLSSTDAGNYTSNTTATTTADITKRSLTVGITPSNKVYNANTTAAVTYTDNRISGDVLSFSSTNTFSDKNAASGKTVTASGIIVSNTDAGNYDYNTTATALANITKRPLTVTGTFTVAHRQYDATTDATPQVTLPVLAGLSDVQSGDDAVLSGTPTFTFAQATVGTSIGISTSGYSVVGVDADNYALTQPSFTANITQRPLTIGGALVVAASRTYDRGVTASITDASQLLLQNVPSPDANNPSRVALTGLSAAFVDKNVGTAKPVSLTAASLTGTTAANYTLTTAGAPTTTADITRRSVTITITPSGKTYDGTDTASVTYQDTRLSSDSFTVSGTATFSDKNVGVSKTVTATGITLSGTDAGNYTPNSTATNTASISPRSLTVSTTGVNRVYDRTTSASVTYSDNRISGDVFTISSTSTFATKIVGNGKPITTTGITLSGTDAGNYTPNSTANSAANVTARPLSVTISSTDKVYDGLTSASVSYLDDRVTGDLFTVSGTATFSDKNIGSAKTVTASSITISGADANNYVQNTSTTTTANITVRTLVVTAVADTKMYDANVNATSVYSDNRVAGDVFIVSGTATFANKTAAAGKTVTITNITISGTDAGNYTQNTSTTSTAEITQRPLEVTGTLQAQDKVYDGSRTATYDIADLTLVGVQGSDLVGVTNPRGRFRTDANVGVNKIVELTSFQFTGADLGNYAVSVNNSPITYASITPRTLNVTITASNKVYDGNTNATVTYADNRVSGDVMTVSGTATFSDKNIGTTKVVTANGITLSGTAAGNYTQNTVASSTANITVRSLAVTITAGNKTYDGNTNASVTYLDNRVAGDAFTVSGTATFATKTVANGKTVTANSITIEGTDAANYTHNVSTTALANITSRSLTVTITASDKVYDRLTAAGVVYADNRVAGDTFTVSGNATFSDRGVGANKTVTATGIAISGTDAANYTQNTTATTTANITARPLVVTITASNKIYNASVTATVSYADNRVSGDLFTVSGSATFDDKTAASGKTVTATGIAITGTDAANYSHNTTATTTAAITQRTLTVTGSFTLTSRQYDATTNATNQVTVPVSAGLSDVQSGDDTTLDGTPTFTFAQANVGNNIGISTSGYSLVGADATNYVLTQPTFSANITQRPLTIGGALVVAPTKTYDRGVSSSITDSSALVLENVPAGDANTPSKVALTGLVAQYNNKTVADAKAVTLTAASLTGTTASNYTLSLTGAPTTTADVTARNLNVTITASHKTYDATDSASVTYADNRLAGDSLVVSGTATFANKNVGTSKIVTANGITISGPDAGNYTQNTTATTTANVTPRSLTVTLTASNKVYDGNTTAPVTYVDNRLTGDVFTVSGTSTFATKTVGTSKAVTATGISLSGTDAGNYTSNTTASATANISLRTLVITANASDKTYDRTTSASVSLTNDRVSGDVLSITFSSSTFDTRNAGANKTVTVSGISVTGTDAANYSFAASVTTTATINQRTLNVTVTPTNKVYDGTDVASVSYSDNRISGDQLTVSGVATYNSKAAANGKTVTSSQLSITGLDAANYTLPSLSVNAVLSANITPRVVTITGTFTVAHRHYDATTDATSQVTPPNSPGLSDIQLSDDVSLMGTPTFTFAQATVGTNIGITTTGYSLSGADAANYTLTSPTFSANITQRPLTIGGSLITPSSRVYNNTTAATISTPSALTLVNVPANDANDATKIALASPVAAFADEHTNETKTVSLVSAGLSGSRSANYTLSLTGSPTTTAEIAPKPLLVSIAASNKTYDGTTTATVTYSDDRISGDTLTVSGTPTFATKTVGATKTVTASSITLTGPDATNYTPNNTATATANITARTLTVTIAANNKTYDGSTTAVVTYGDDRVLGDTLTVSGTPTFATKTVGDTKTVTASSISLNGPDAANYSANTTATTIANITRRSLTVTIAADNKTYDGTTSAVVTYGDDRVVGDTLTVSGTPTFASKTAGNSKVVTASGIALTGPDAANYTPNATATTTANIATRALNVTITATHKVYDATDSAAVTYADNRISGDALTVSGTPTFASKTAGDSKVVTASGISLTGPDAANYTPNATATTTANITRKPLVVSIVASNKTYDGTTSATVSYGDDRISGDTLTATGAPTFATKAVGNNKTVTASSITLAGPDAANYLANSTATTTANITTRPLVISVAANNKTYDGTTSATVTYGDDRVSGDTLTTSGTASFASKTVGDAKTVTALNIALTGPDAANYSANTTATTSANITLRTLTVTIAANNKTYDGTNNATVTYGDNRISGDNLTISGTASFNNKHAGNTKTVTAVNISVVGGDASNYSHNTEATTSANVTRRSLVVTPTAASRTYDATNIATVTYADDRLDGDTFTISSTAVFDDAELGRNKPVSVTNIALSGPDADNYLANSSAVSSGDITVREITADIPVLINNQPLSNSTPTVLVGDLVPSVDTTVTFTRQGFSNVVCSFVPQHTTESCVSPTLADGTWTYRARQLIAGLMVAASEPFTITIDTTAPLATRPAAFQANSDTGPSTSDGITNDNTPTVVISEASATDAVVVTATSNSQTVQCSFTATATEQMCVLPALGDGSWTITAVITDQANNSSNSTPPFVAVIDTVAPVPSAAPFNAQDNGATTSLVATPRISVPDVASGEIATISGLSTRSETSSCSFTASPTVNFCQMSSMASGTWTLTSVISDLAGNASAVSAPTQIIISAGLAPVTVARSAITPQPTSNRRENVVSVKFGSSAALAGVQSVSFIVFDNSGKVVRRSTVKVNPEDTGARIVIPRSLQGARVRVVTTNQCGVSEGAPRGFNVRPGKTAVTIDRRTNTPTLAGQLVLPQIDFGPSEITLDARDKARLDEVVKEMKGKCGTLLVSGFSRHNPTDTKKYLQNLADFRAQAVANYLSGKGVNMWINYQGFIIRSNDKGASVNRRVALHWTPS